VALFEHSSWTIACTTHQSHVIDPTGQPLGRNEFDCHASIRSGLEHGIRNRISLHEEFARLLIVQGLSGNLRIVGQDIEPSAVVATPVGHLEVDGLLAVRVMRVLYQRTVPPATTFVGTGLCSLALEVVLDFRLLLADRNLIDRGRLSGGAGALRGGKRLLLRCGLIRAS
jgi:hypothetical protein